MFSFSDSNTGHSAAEIPFQMYLSQLTVLEIIKTTNFCFLYLSTLTLKKLGNSIKQLYIYTVFVMLFIDFKVKEEFYA